MLARSIRHCYALGDFLLGLFTALLGRNAIWVCTDSIESTVLHHLEWQLEFLIKNDLEVYAAVLSIKVDEESHREFGQINGKNLFGAASFWPDSNLQNYAAISLLLCSRGFHQL